MNVYRFSAFFEFRETILNTWYSYINMYFIRNFFTWLSPKRWQVVGCFLHFCLTLLWLGTTKQNQGKFIMWWRLVILIKLPIHRKKHNFQSKYHQFLSGVEGSRYCHLQLKHIYIWTCLQSMRNCMLTSK